MRWHEEPFSRKYWPSSKSTCPILHFAFMWKADHTFWSADALLWITLSIDLEQGMILSQSKAKQMYLSMLLVKNVDRVLGLFRACIMALVQNEIHYTHLICNIMSISRLRWGETKCDSICLIESESVLFLLRTWSMTMACHFHLLWVKTGYKSPFHIAQQRNQ